MKFKFRNVFILFSSLLFISCAVVENLFIKKAPSLIEHFDNQKEFQKNWINNSWKSPASYSLEDGKLKITTRPNSKDRVKVRSRQAFTTGSYTWKIFIPTFKPYEQVSIGAFLYHNAAKEFEFDFEIGYGQKIDREKINLKEEEAIVFCVSQFSPSNSSHFGVKMGEFSDFKIELLDIDGFYLVKWYINNQKVKELQTKVKSTIKFKAHCSLENLHFMGDVKTSSENFVLFDRFSFLSFD